MQKLRQLHPKPLTPDAFAPFGDVIASDVPGTETRSINEGHTTRFHDLARVLLDAGGGRPTINIFRSDPLPTPLVLKLFERHPLSSQAFMPLSGNPYLVVVAPRGEFDPAAVVAFLATPHQGVNYHPGTWHHYSLALRSTSDFLVVDREGPGENCDEILLNEPDWIQISKTS